MLLICKPRRRVVELWMLWANWNKDQFTSFGLSEHGVMGTLWKRKRMQSSCITKKKEERFCSKHIQFQRQTLSKTPRQIRHANNLLIFTHNSLTLEHELNLIIIENHLKIALSSSALSYRGLILLAISRFAWLFFS